jgi:peptide-methionine (S)-S-oxide reductase
MASSNALLTKVSTASDQRTCQKNESFSNRGPLMKKPAFAIVAVLMLTSTSAYAKDIQKAIFAGGCFWCVESDFEMVKGVKEAKSGYIGGSKKTASYKKITKGGTGHYEAVEITFDADQVSYETLLDVFWRSVDATDAGGQFCDRGESYRTAIFARNSGQLAAAEKSKAAIDASGVLPSKIVTPIFEGKKFYDAEDYHQDYYKGEKKVLTRFGWVKQSDAYKRYRKGCGRDARVKQLWGDKAFVVSGY